MYELDRSEKLKKILLKLSKKDKNRYEATIKKIKEVLKETSVNEVIHRNNLVLLG